MAVEVFSAASGYTGVSPEDTATVYLDEDLSSYISLADFKSNGPFTVVENFGPGGSSAEAFVNIPGPFGPNVNAYEITIYSAEGGGGMTFTLPGVVLGDAGTGVNRIFARWYEKRSSDYDFGAEKTFRTNSVKANGNVSLDIIPGITSTGSVPRDSNTLQYFGQGEGNDSNFNGPGDALNWDRSQWHLLETEVDLGSATQGVFDGVVRFWFDEVMITEVTGLDLVEAATLPTIHRLLFGGWDSGAGTYTKTRAITYMKVSDQYIGPE